MRYDYRTTAGIKPVIPADVAGSELQRIYEERRALTAEAIVEAAQPLDAPLHPVFEWDDSVAAEQYRLVQARQLVRSVVLVSQPERNEHGPTVRAFVSLHRPEPERPQARIYKPILEALAVPDEREALLLGFQRELAALRQRYSALLEIDGVINAQFSALAAVVEQR
jgi:hypothetical protein